MTKTISIKGLLLIMLAAFLSGCGGSSSSSTPTPTGTSNWDEMVWDQDKWG